MKSKDVWIYKVESLEIRDGKLSKLEDVLDTYGERGWELVQVQPVINTDTHVAIFKMREIVTYYE
jgi:hypothetical protein